METKTMPAPEKRRPGRPKREGGASTQVALRLPPEVMERVRAHAERLRHELPGMTVTVADALRMLVVAGLDATARRSTP